VLDRTRNRVQPDVFAVRLVDGGRPPYPYELRDLLLAIEVESPDNPAYDYQTKRRLYLSNGVPEFVSARRHPVRGDIAELRHETRREMQRSGSAPAAGRRGIPPDNS
jgi:hypothetical protein